MHGLLKRAYNTAKKSRSMDDLRMNHVSGPLTDCQRSALFNVLAQNGIDNRRVHHAPTECQSQQVRPNSQLKQHLHGAGTHPLIRSSSSTDAFMMQRMAITDTSKKRAKAHRRFRKVFVPLIGESAVISRFSCVLYQDSIAHGQLYVTKNWFCFYANLMGKARTVAIDVSKILSISQGKTAKLIPNAVKIVTQQETYVFSSFMSRDRAFKALVEVWKDVNESNAASDLSDVECMTQLVPSINCMKEKLYIEKSESECSSERNTPFSSAELDNSDGLVFLTSHSRKNGTNGSDKTDAISNTVTDEDYVKEEPRIHLYYSKVEANTNSNQHNQPSGERKKICKRRILEDVFESDGICLLSIIGLGVILFSIFYLSLRIINLENDQAYAQIKSLLEVHEKQFRYQMKSSVQLNTNMLQQISSLVRAFQKLVESSALSQSTG